MNNHMYILIFYVDTEKIRQTARTNHRYWIHNVIHYAFRASHHLPAKEKRKWVTDRPRPMKLAFLQRTLERHNTTVRRLAFT